ncbi:unnamed protein product [Camellia sinensis]
MYQLKEVRFPPMILWITLSNLHLKGVLYDKDQFVRWARDVYKNDGVVLVIRSSKDDKIYFRCERHGESAKKKNGQTISKKCNCPFQIVGSKKKNGIWSLRKIDGSHNH